MHRVSRIVYRVSSYTPVILYKMLPILADFGFMKIYTFGVFLTLAFFWGAFFLWKNISLTSHKEDEVFDGVFSAIIGAVLIGRIEYVALHFSDFGYSISKFVLINGYPGIGVIGFIAGFWLSLVLFTSSRKIAFRSFVDHAVPPFILAIAIIKLGAFFAGTQVGTQTAFFLSLSYSHLDGMRHLTPLYESILFFVGSFFSYKILRSIRRNNLFEGFNLIFFVWLFSFITVVFDPITSFRTLIKGISFDLVLGSLFLLTTTVYLIYHFRDLIIVQSMRVFAFRKKK